MISVSALQALKQAKTLHDVAALLGYRPSALSYLLYQIPKDNKYTTFTIPKKGGGERTIDAPIPKIKVLQRRLADVLSECSREIDAGIKGGNTISHAFRESHSIITNARAHKARRYVLNLDLESFFPSLNFGRIRAFFLKNNHFKLDAKAATIIAQIACNKDVLPQGSPCSPILSELLTHFLDIRLTRMAKTLKCTYTRYVDDLTFSTNQKSFPAALATLTDNGWALGDELKSRIENAGFKINAIKTRMQCRGRRQTVTGLIVNEKVNVTIDYYKRARAMTHAMLTKGAYKHDNKETNSLAALEGILNHIYHVKERQIDLGLAAEKNLMKRKRLFKERAEAKDKEPSTIRVLYHRLVFYKHFIDPAMPLIVCEGETDPVYLKAAIRRLRVAHPKLATINNGNPSLKVRLFKNTSQARDVLQLRGGVSDLKHFLLKWKRLLPQYKHRPMQHPIIVLVDNDKGANQIFSALKSFNVTANHTTDLPFYYLGENLYLVKTPTKNADGFSYIEQFFQPSVLQTPIDGKIFNPNKEHQAANEYGKVVFAEKLVKPNAGTIDFSGFEPILTRIDAVLDHYAQHKPPAPAALAAPPA